MILILLSFLLVVDSASCPTGYNSECIKVVHTAEYTLNYKLGNQNNYFYDSNTFGVDLIDKYNLPKCEKYTREQFIKLLYKYNIKCKIGRAHV